MWRTLSFLMGLFAASSALLASEVRCRVLLNEILLSHQSEAIEIPVFGDIHGNYFGLLRSIQKLQVRTKTQYPVVLQVGDLGFWRNKHSVETYERKGFDWKIASGVHRYLSDSEAFRDILEDRRPYHQVRSKIFFLRGNHDDAVELTNRNRYRLPLQSIENSRMLYYISDGARFSIRNDRTELRMASLGGIDGRTRPQSAARKPHIVFEESAINSLLDSSSPVDVFLTHQGGTHSRKGSTEISALTEILSPQLHLFGHSHATSHGMVGPTQSLGLSIMPPETNPPLGNGFMGILRCEGSPSRCSFHSY